MPTEAVSSDRRRAGDAALKVLIADDHPLLLAGIRRVLERDAQIEVVGEAHSGPELIQLVERRRPHVVLMDLRMPGVTGAECIAQISATWPAVKIVVLSACDDRASIDSALQAGANAYVVKSVEPSDIASLIRQTSSGSVYHATGRASAVDEPEPHVAARPGLTNRELVILEAVAAGLTTAAISKDLWVSEHTVKFHLTNIYRKLGVPNRAAAIRYALDNELVAA
jgi:DNA-binding NarL/FixJ family response regulator